MDEMLEALRRIRFKYADHDPSAIQALEFKLIDVARQRKLIPYSELVRGVTFQIPGVRRGNAFPILEFGDFERDLIADFLGYINLRSRERNGLLLSTLVELKGLGEPGQGFFKWFRPYMHTDAHTFWAQEVARVHDFYAANS